MSSQKGGHRYIIKLRGAAWPEVFHDVGRAMKFYNDHKDDIEQSYQDSLVSVFGDHEEYKVYREEPFNPS